MTAAGPRIRRVRPLPATAVIATSLLAALATHASAADLPPDLVARFTRQVQPLVLNRCAAGACHGGPQAHAPRLRRGAFTPADTLANAAAVRDLLGPDGDPGPLVQRLAVRHPAEPTSRTLVMTPLTPGERGVLEGWLVDAHRAAPRATIHDPAVRLADHTEPSAPPARPNRLRTLLDTGAPPPAARGQASEGSSSVTGIVDLRNPPAAGLTPESAPPSPPPGTAGSPPARPDAPSSPGPTAKGSR